MRMRFGWMAAILTTLLAMPAVVRAAGTAAESGRCCPICPFGR